MARLLVVAHIPSDNTRRLRDAVVAGIRAADAADLETVALTPFEAGGDDILAADAVILGTTENLGYMSGALKDFFDRSYYPCLDRTQGCLIASMSAPATTAPARAAASRPSSPACAGAPCRSR